MFTRLASARDSCLEQLGVDGDRMEGAETWIKKEPEHDKLTHYLTASQALTLRHGSFPDAAPGPRTPDAGIPMATRECDIALLGLLHV